MHLYKYGLFLFVRIYLKEIVIYNSDTNFKSYLYKVFLFYRAINDSLLVDI